MTEEEFIVLRDKVIDEIRNLPLYQEFKKIDKEIYIDEQVCTLTEEKEKLISEYKFLDDKEKDEMLKRIVAIQKQIDELPIVKRYYELKKELKDLVEPIDKEIIKKLYL